jgi:RNA polymerase sigma-70 factor, ECF subfamily
VYNERTVEEQRLGRDRADTEADDGLLVERARDGDTDAFGMLVTRYAPVATQVAYLVAPGADVEDTVQEAFVRAWRALAGFRVGAPFRPWLCRIVANEAKNRSRSAHRRDALALRNVASSSRDEPPTPEGVVLERDEAVALVRAMNALRQDDRLIIAYRWLLELSEAEIAAALDVPVGTVKSRLSRAMTKLRTHMVGDGGSDDL